MNTKNDARKKEDSLRFLDDETVPAGSSTEATGLIPASPRSQEEYDSYKDICHFTPQPPANGTDPRGCS